MPNFRFDDDLVQAYKERARLERISEKALVAKAIEMYLKTPILTDPQESFESSVFVSRQEFQHLCEQVETLTQAFGTLSERLATVQPDPVLHVDAANPPDSNRSLEETTTQDN
ncbi:hypothetical protein ACQ4M3_29185 [Leptolyngbya sp. AN03gr2]|uniref:hypothetical protein n=1 Tax=unclassified Leptolyngbya TaxID=2650499 RepID=UPI003D313EF4